MPGSTRRLADSATTGSYDPGTPPQWTFFGDAARAAVALADPVDGARDETTVSASALSAVLDVLHRIAPSAPPKPGVAPDGEGGVQLVWYTSWRDLEVNVSAEGVVDIAWVDEHGDEAFAFSPEKLAECLARLTGLCRVPLPAGAAQVRTVAP